MDLEKIIDDLEKRHQSAVAKAEGLRKEFEGAALEASQLDQRLGEARRLLSYYRPEKAHLPESEQVDDDRSRNGSDAPWRPMPRNHAILRLLRETGEPLGPAEIAQMMAERGRENDSPNYVSAALANLKKQGKVYSPVFGKWTTADREPPGDARLTNLLDRTRG